MQDVQDKISGLRERKRADTHARVHAAAMELFGRKGFEATTLDDIASSAGVSRRSLFHYFASKEDIVLSTKAGLGDLIEAAVARRPADEPLLTMAENALTDMAADFQGPGPRALARLIHDTPALRAGDQAKYEALEGRLALAMATRKDLPADDLQARVVATTAIGVLRMATETWLASDDDRGPEVHGKAAFAALRQAATRID
ncbi:TetR/AcrR family transcriptional regulator [Brevundimonas subvibrioides]|uniref:Regulatory protein TetR n=1 Tax=Brevundimonas subvibrioides (strain ATCC 15264 / DSM 4735 / LMG 14903 / NBRC 16000 / CB 81) TaxID=633149 RepID=D9QM94_BRESC|nr:TetR/AcrR family transcriptional regulator [Brevundimonas subvibrioides]ADL02020.1 regulatory protein TetR [Brevundimonas subvibrioides ATCC 15264]